MLVVEEGSRAEEAFLAHLALVGAGRQVAMRLPGGRAFDAGVADIAFHESNLVTHATNGKLFKGVASLSVGVGRAGSLAQKNGHSLACHPSASHAKGCGPFECHRSMIAVT